MALRTVTGTIKRANGKPWYGAKVGFSTVASTYTGDATFPQYSLPVNAADGTFSIDLEADLPVLWDCQLPDGETFRFELVGGDEPVSLEQLRADAEGRMSWLYRGNTEIGMNTTISVSTASTQLAPANSSRASILVSNPTTDDMQSIYLGFGTAATLSGFELVADGDLMTSSQGAIYAITTNGTVSVVILEEVKA